MQVAIVIALLVNIALLAVVLLLVRRIQQHSTTLSEQVSETTQLVGAPHQLDTTFSSGKTRLITVEILNPLELAATQNRFAGMIGTFAPERIRRVVYERAAVAMTAQLIDEGLDVDAQVHVGS